jgi:hypothetical protein
MYVTYNIFMGLYPKYSHPAPRETREGWPLQTVKTEPMEAYGEQIKGVFLNLVCLACRVGTRDLHPGVTALVSPVQIFFSLPHTFSLYVSPHRPATWAVGRQSCWVACLLVCVSGLTRATA